MGEKKGEEAAENKNVFMPVFRRFLCKFSISGQEKLKCDEGDQLTEQKRNKTNRKQQRRRQFPSRKNKGNKKKKYNKIKKKPKKHRERRVIC